MSRCRGCGWDSKASHTHEEVALARAERIGGIRARRHVRTAAKDDRSRAAWAKLGRLFKRTR